MTYIDADAVRHSVIVGLSVVPGGKIREKGLRIDEAGTSFGVRQLYTASLIYRNICMCLFSMWTLRNMISTLPRSGAVVPIESICHWKDSEGTNLGKEKLHSGPVFAPAAVSN